MQAQLVIEVSYDQVSGARFRHGTRLLRFRPDQEPRQCTFEQLEGMSRPGKLITQVIRHPARAATGSLRPR